MNLHFSVTKNLGALSLGFASLVSPQLASAACGDPVQITGVVVLSSGPLANQEQAATLTVPECGRGTLTYTGPGASSTLVTNVDLTLSVHFLHWRTFFVGFKDPTAADSKSQLVFLGSADFDETNKEQTFNGQMFRLSPSELPFPSLGGLEKFFEDHEGAQLGEFEFKVSTDKPLFKPLVAIRPENF